MIHITIIIDKSTFQSLSFLELHKLTSYYKHNITPVLVMEVLGDLKKEIKEEQVPSELRVKDFAKKLFPTQTVVNTQYQKLIAGELLGIPVNTDGRPSLDAEKAIQSSDGREGVIISETREEKAIYQWKDGHFTEADHELSALWRSKTTQHDLLTNMQTLIKQANGELKLKSMDELSKFVETELTEQDKQDRLLAYLIDNYITDQTLGTVIFDNWMSKGRPLIKEFAPYCYHCLKVDMFLIFGLQSNLIGDRPTNRIDMEYLYYLPFCNVFTSYDKVHKKVVPYLLSSYQQFVTGEELKADFKAIVDYLEEHGEETKKKYNHEPPLIEDSVTFILWKKYFGYPARSNMKRNLPPEDVEKMREQMKIFIQAAKEGKEVYSNGKKLNFMYEKSYMSMDDLCFCGSGKKVIDCCIPYDEFTKLSQQNK